MAYAILRQGNNNTSENKKLQQALKDAGYGKYLGSAGVDGIYGSGTAAAVKAYQKANGLAVDGIAGNETLGHLYGSKSSSTAKKTVAEPTPAKTYRYDADNDANYQQALKNAESVKAEKPEYAGTYDEQVKALFDKIMNREPFEYDLNGDALWKQYSDQYTQKGKLAMMDAMGQAAALTGGYGSSYGQGVGQQAYQGYLQNLNDRIPELYQLALQKYNAEAAAQQEQFGAARELQADEYGKYQDAMNQHNVDVDRAQSAADTAWDRGYNSWYTETQLRNQDEETAYNRQQTAYANLANLIAGAGYSPTAEELKAAGMSKAQANAFKMQYKKDQAAAAAKYTTTGTPAYKINNTSIADIVDKCAEFKKNGDNNGLAAYLDGLVLTGAISADYADQLYDQNRTKNTVDSIKTDVPANSSISKKELLEMEKQRTKNQFSSGISPLDIFK